MFLKKENMYLSFTLYLIYISKSTSLGMKVDIATENCTKFFFLIFNISLCESDWFCAFLST